MKHGSWILGGGWNNDIWGGEPPMASWINDVTLHNPVRKYIVFINCLNFKIYIIIMST